MTTPPLFDVDLPPVPEPEDISAGTRRVRRQAAAIERGVHPLGLVRPPMAIHPDAMPFPATKQNAHERSIRCGTCVFRDQHNGFPKCLFGLETKTRKGFDGREYTYQQYPRAARSLATDVRGWWPGCTDWQALP